MLSWEDFKKVDIRTGTIIEVEDFPEARTPAFKLHIDFGDLGIRKTSAQITDLYDKASLKGLQVLAVVNFPPKQIANIMSECLVLGAVDSDGKVTLATTERPAPDGLRIS